MNYTPNSLTLEDLEEFLEELQYGEEMDTRIELPAAYLLAITDEEFIAIYKSKNTYKIMPCGEKMYSKIKEREKLLLK